VSKRDPYDEYEHYGRPPCQTCGSSQHSHLRCPGEFAEDAEPLRLVGDEPIERSKDAE
jgi:hypothetical protein